MENDNSVCFVLWFNIAKGFKAWPKDQNCVHNFFVYIFPIYHRVQGWRRGVGLKTWQNRGCCSYIGVFWSAMVIFNVRKLTWFCTTLTAIPVGYWTILTKMIRRVCRTVMGELHIRRSTDRPGEGRGSLSWQSGALWAAIKRQMKYNLRCNIN